MQVSAHWRPPPDMVRWQRRKNVGDPTFWLLKSIAAITAIHLIFKVCIVGGEGWWHSVPIDGYWATFVILVMCNSLKLVRVRARWENTNWRGLALLSRPLETNVTALWKVLLPSWFFSHLPLISFFVIVQIWAKSQIIVPERIGMGGHLDAVAFFTQVPRGSHCIWAVASCGSRPPQGYWGSGER